MGKKLLVADDSLTIQKVIKLALSHDGYEIQTVADGNEFLAQLSLFRPDVVLIDLGLPGKSTFDVKKEMNETSDLKDIPVVLMASAFEKVDEAKVGLLKFDGRLTKPFDPSHLRDVLSRAMTSRGIPQDFKPSDLPPPPAPPKAQPKFAEPISLSDPIWSSDLGSASTDGPSLSDSLPPPPGGTDFVVRPPAVEMQPTEDAHPEFESRPELFLKDEKTDEVQLPPLSLNEPVGPDMSSPLDRDDSDIKRLTESTVNMSGLDDLAGWNINEPKPSPSLPSIFEPERPGVDQPTPVPGVTRLLHPSSPTPPPPPSGNSGIFSTPPRPRPEDLLADLPTSKEIEEMVEKQVKAQLEEMIQAEVEKRVAEHLERFVKNSLPDVSERIVKGEIRKLLEGLS